MTLQRSWSGSWTGSWAAALASFAITGSACVPANPPAGGEPPANTSTGGSGGNRSASGGNAGGTGGSGAATNTGSTGGNTGSGGSTSGNGGAASGGSSGAGGSGGAASDPGTGGSTGSGGAPGDAGDPSPPMTADARPTDAGGDGRPAENMPPPLPNVTPPAFPPLSACAKTSVDHLTQWLAWSGTTVPPTGANFLAKEGDQTVAKISLKNCTAWCQLVVPIANSLGAQVDLSKSAGFLLKYSSTSDLNVQLRPASRYDGGDKWLMFIPSTGGKVEEKFFPFAPEAWYWLRRLGQPTYPFATALKDARSFVFVTRVPNEVVFHGLRFDGHDPGCR
jgi:hypothetical protein